MRLRIIAASIALAALIAVVGCGGDSPEQNASEEVQKQSEKRSPYLPKNEVEFKNYNKAQQLYDSPATIIWCSVMPQASTAPIVTVPVAGKLTSSSTTFFRPEEEVGVGGSGPNPLGSARSVDGLFHPNPPKYRYGFTPGGQYVDFFELPTLCTTQPLEFQRKSVEVQVDGNLDRATKQAERALAKGKTAEAQAILQGATE